MAERVFLVHCSSCGYDVPSSTRLPRLGPLKGVCAACQRDIWDAMPQGPWPPVPAIPYPANRNPCDG
jgi:hypothetical protein